MAPATFRARLRPSGPKGAWTHVVLPKKVSARLGARGMVRVAGTLNGTPFRTSAMPTGDGAHSILVNRALRRAAGVLPRDAVRLTVEVDARPRVVRAPPDLRAALAASPRAAANYQALAPSHKKAFVGYIAEAKRAETRARRVERSVAMLGRGRGAWQD